MAVSYNRIEVLRQGLGRVCQGTTATGKVGTHKMNNYVVASSATAETLYVPLDLTQVTTVHIIHNAADEPLISASATLLDNDDISHADMMWEQTYDGTDTSYLATDDRALIGLKIVANPANGAIRITVTQTRRQR